jgi:ATP-dependent RNA helicase DDX55/SPB4
MATAGVWQDLGGTPIDSRIIKALNDLGFPTMTPAQAAAIPPLLSSRDVAVDAETGSGKTLSFLVPAAQMLLFAAGTRCLAPSASMRVLIIVPTRELAAQVHASATALFSALPGNVTPVPLIGGEGAGSGPGPARKYAADLRLIVATPGRLEAAINAGAIVCRQLELLIMDEADRLLDMGFAVSLTSILTKLPKQRRTGLYSATQTNEVEELARAGLRNPVRVAVRVKVTAPSPTAGTPDSFASQTVLKDSTANSASGRRVIPASLTCFYAVLGQDHKLHHIARLLAKHREEKFIIYVLTCACVDFLAHVPLLQMAACRMVDNDEDAPLECEKTRSTYVEAGFKSRPILGLHGKMSQTKRTRALDAFAKSSNALLICTDVAARGLDIPDVDWVVQFDAPQDPDAYVHRVGRTARLGRQGFSLIYLAPYEDAYADFLSIRKCPVKPFEWQKGSNDSDLGCADDAPVCTEMNKLVRNAVLADRAVLDAAEQGFLSYLRAYKEHRCSYLLPFESLDIGAVARSFSLLRLPRFQEFKKHRAKLSFVPDKTICIRDIAYKDRTREAFRQEQINHALANQKSRREALKSKSKKMSNRARKRKAEAILGTKAAEETKSRRGPSTRDSLLEDMHAASDADEMNEEARLIRKLRRGKLSHQDFDKEAGYADSA